MGLIIGLGSYLGFKLDNYFKLDNLFTVCSFISWNFWCFILRDSRSKKNSLIVQKIIYSLRVLVFADSFLLHFTLISLGLTPFEIKIEEFYIIHFFNFSLFVTSNLIIDFISKLKNNFGFAFLGMSVFKMLLMMVYLGIIIIQNQNSENYALQFVFIYFIYLFYDVLMAIKTSKTKINS